MVSLGSSFILEQQRSVYMQALGLPAPVDAVKNQTMLRTPWEYLAMGRSLLWSGDLAGAATRFEQGLEMRPEDFWLNFYMGLCDYRQKRFEPAVSRFHACVVLTTNCAECWHNRALAYAASGQSALALHDYARALKLNPNLAAAAFNRGVHYYYQEKRYSLALADFQLALAGGIDPAPAHYNLALVYLALGDRKAALASVQECLHYNAAHAEARSLKDRLIGK
jgi:tetratricopeptide (TPR) repeat protein